VKIFDHANHTEDLYNLRAEDIHKWIDGYFDKENFGQFLQYGKTESFNPYDHRSFRHCREALPEVIKEFSTKYTIEEITKVFECHIKDDYNDYIPSREDFINGTFTEKYHESEQPAETILTPLELNRYFKGLHYKRLHEKKSWKGGFYLRILLPVLLSLLLFVTSLFVIILPLFHNSLMAEKEEMIRELSTVAVSILDYYISLEKEGTYTHDQSQKSALDEIRKLRYGPQKDLYFWITDRQPVMLMHPWRPDLEGQDLSEFTDSKNKSGKKIFAESVTLVEEQGGGFIEYLWQLDENRKRVVPKLSYVKGVDPWQWIIGTGLYVHDVEEEISRLSIHLTQVFLVIFILMILILFYITRQSHLIEKNRLKAEAGLVEAKNRYRALVEASNEGYILLLNQKNVFCNPTFQRMTGYSEEKIQSDSFWQTLMPEDNRNENLKSHLLNIMSQNPRRDEFEASVQCSSGNSLDVIIRVSRFFLPEENGHIISFTRAQSASRSMPLLIDLNKNHQSDNILTLLGTAENSIQVVRLLNELPQSVKLHLLDRESSRSIRGFISLVYEISVQKLVTFALDEMGPAPVEFAFISLGSSGRQEMTLFSDQDNALVFACDIKGEELEKLRMFFLKLSQKVCVFLDKGGFSFCPGGIMAVNPAWCLSFSEWHNQYVKWIGQADNVSLLDVHVFFDIRCAYGSKSLVSEMQRDLIKLSNKNPEFLALFAKNCLQYKMPLGFLGNVRTESIDGADVLNVKKCLIPLINFVRIYAMKNGLGDASTVIRMEELLKLNIFSNQSFKSMTESYEMLWELRFYNQILTHGELRKVNDDLLLSSLPEEKIKELQKALGVIKGLQSRLSYDFLGIDLS